MDVQKFVPMNDEDFNKALQFVNNYRDHLLSLRQFFDKKRNKDTIQRLDNKIQELNNFLDGYLLFPEDNYEK